MFKPDFSLTRKIIVALMCVTTAHQVMAATETTSVEPLIMFAVPGIEAEFMSLDEAFAAIQAKWNIPAPNGGSVLYSRTITNLHPWRVDYWGMTNGMARMSVTDSTTCWNDGTCQTSPDAGPSAEMLAPRCPRETKVVNGVTYRYELIAKLPITTADRTVWCELTTPAIDPLPKSCPWGNPIYPSTGVKIQVETDYLSRGNSLEFVRTYRSNHGSFASVANQVLLDNVTLGAIPPPACLPGTYMENLNVQQIRGYCYYYVVPPVLDRGIDVMTAEGRRIRFNGPADNITTSPEVNDRLVQRLTAEGAREWVLRRESGHVEVYDSIGLLRWRVSSNGTGAVSYSYSTATTPVAIAHRAGLLIEMTDPFGRRLNFTYNEANQLAGMTDPAGAVNVYGYDGFTNLTSVAYPGGSVRSYSYNDAADINGGVACANVGTAFDRALTGIHVDGSRFATFKYACSGRAVSTEHAGGVSKFSVAYGASTAQVVGPTGSRYDITFDASRETGVSQPGGAGCLAASNHLVHDAQGNRVVRDDFNGTRSCYANDLSRNLETSRVEGLSQSAVCSTVTPANAVLPANGRKTSTQWHPDWRLETKVAEPGRILTKVYNGQPDPFNGGAVASCAPADALLPDGKPIAVLCKQVEQATTDANGASGFSATLQSGVATRQTSWTYNRHGQVLTENGPRTDVNDVTTYTYYPDTSFTGVGAAATGHFIGDLATVTNAAGRVTQYTHYNRHGQLLQSLDPNGVATVNTYDLRQRLLSTTTGGQTTRYQYDPAGQLKRVTLPDGAWIGYDYDNAHRQVAAYDNLGNRTDYTLDNAGNRTGETTRDPGGALKRQLSRSIDALGRVQQTTGRE